MLKQSKSSSRPVPLTNRGVSTAESDDDSDQAANFACESIFSLLKADNNETLLGKQCLLPYSLTQAPAGNEVETINIDSEHTNEQRQPSKLC
jgi:hypothetical protein